MTDEFFDEAEKKVLELETRKKVYELVKKFAGIHIREIERKSELSTGSVTYHLNYLSKKGLIEERKDKNNIRYFTKGFQSENKKLIGLLRQKSIRRILLYLLTNEKCNHEQITKFVKLSPSTVSWHLSKLEQENIIGYVKDGRKKFYNLLIDKNEIINLLITYQETFFDKLVDNVIEMWDTN
jgi:predicted transcriptional regulator